MEKTEIYPKTTQKIFFFLYTPRLTTRLPWQQVAIFKTENNTILMHIEFDEKSLSFILFLPLLLQGWK